MNLIHLLCDSLNFANPNAPIVAAEVNCPSLVVNYNGIDGNTGTDLLTENDTLINHVPNVKISVFGAASDQIWINKIIRQIEPSI